MSKSRRSAAFASAAGAAAAAGPSGLVAAVLGATGAYLSWEGAPSGGVSDVGTDPRVVPGEVVTP